MLKITLSYLKDNFKYDFKTTKLISTQLGTTQPQLVLQYYLYKKCPKFKNVWFNRIGSEICLTKNNCKLEKIGSKLIFSQKQAGAE